MVGKVLGWRGSALWPLKITPGLSSDEHVAAPGLDGATDGNSVTDTGGGLSVDEDGAAPGSNHVLVAWVRDTAVGGVVVSDTSGGASIDKHVRAPLYQRDGRAGVVSGTVVI